TRPAMSIAAGVHSKAAVPRFHGKTLVARASAEAPPVNRDAPGFGRKAVIYATCFVNYNNPDIGMAARAVLAKNGVETEVVYPGCCGMPKLEHGDLPRVAELARKVVAELIGWIDKGYDIVALVPSCTLMLKSEWPLLLPDDSAIKQVAGAVKDITEYVVDISRDEGLAPGLAAVDGGIFVHLACHARAQNIGPQAAEMLRLLPETDVTVMERCSGHGGSWGMMTPNFETGLKIGRPVARKARESGAAQVVSECPLAAVHILQGMERIDGESPVPDEAPHPIQIIARAYGI
ncbi:MAG: heterodisulfide reductase-related iron-sulfur binding cluster, partial [Alphaproteobacteria bacterium]